MKKQGKVLSGVDIAVHPFSDRDVENTGVKDFNMPPKNKVLNSCNYCNKEFQHDSLKGIFGWLKQSFHVAR